MISSIEIIDSSRSRFNKKRRRRRRIAAVDAGRNDERRVGIVIINGPVPVTWPQLDWSGLVIAETIDRSIAHCLLLAAL